MTDMRITVLRAAVSMALPLLEAERRALLECGSLLDDKLEPIPGTLDPELEPSMAEYDAAIVQCAAALRATEQGEGE